MKLMISSILILTFLASCEKKPCKSFGIHGITLSHSDTQTDTDLKVIRYARNTNFETPIDSFTSDPEYHPIVLDTSRRASPNYEYDYLCIAYPSGKEYRITDVSSESRTGTSGMTCVNPIHYSINGEAEMQMGYATMQGFMIELP